MFNRWVVNRFCSYNKNSACFDVGFFYRALFFGDSKISVLQIGANDGVLKDPLYPFVKKGLVKGVMLEPQKEIFLKLCENVASCKDIFLINAALSGSEGEGKIYKVKKELCELYPDLYGVASFDFEHVEKEVSSFLRKSKEKKGVHPSFFIESENIELVSYYTIFSKAGLDKIDLLLIDAEGFDVEAVKLYPFEDFFNPEFVVFEHKHLRKEERNSVEKFLYKFGYSPFYFKNDVVFIKGENFS